MNPTPPPKREIDKARWPQLSPLLDELLDLDAPARAVRLAALRAQDLALAEDLEELLARDAAMALAPVLDSPVLLAQGPTVQPGQQLGPYTLEREIGQGGMGTVWLARRTDGRYEGQVAVKFLTSGLLGRGDSGRFAREGQILGRLAHPHIARLLDAGVAHDGGPPYLVLEYIDGLPIDRYCEQHALDVSARVTLFLDVLAAVAHAHNRLILHRDLKPSNILVNQAGEVKLLDFGIAKLLGDATQPAAATELTQQAGRAFTPLYAAPEQVQGHDVTTATDVYALGVLLYLLLSGQHPTSGATPDDSPLARMKAVLEVEPRRLSEQVRGTPEAKRARELRGDLDTILAKALKKTAAERYANAEAMAADLKHWLAHEPILARPDSAGYRVAKFVRRHRVGVAASSLAGLAIAAGVGVALWKAQEAHEQRVQAEGLIEFMLGDLRKKLEPVGRLDVLDVVGEKALGYYAQQDLARTDADSLGRRARALHLMGEIAEKRGKMGEAEKLFAQAAESTAELLARDPKNTQRLFDHAQSSYWVGYAAWQQRKTPQAEANFARYLELANELVRVDPSNPEWLTEQASAQSNLGVLKLRSGSPKLALDHFMSAQAVWQSLLRARPVVRGELATTLGWVAEAQERLGLFDASIASQQAKSEALVQPDGQTGDDRKAQLRQAAIDAALGRLHLAAGRTEEALAAARRAHETFASLASMDPENLEKLERQAFARQQMVETWQASRKPDQARAELALLTTDLERLRPALASKPQARAMLYGRSLLSALAIANTAEERLAQRKALATFLSDPAVSAATAMQDTHTQSVLALASLTLGDVFATDKNEQVAHWERALSQLSMLGDTSDPRVTCLRPQLLQRLGRTQEARALAEKQEVSVCRHPMYAELGLRLQRLQSMQPDWPPHK